MSLVCFAIGYPTHFEIRVFDSTTVALGAALERSSSLNIVGFSGQRNLSVKLHTGLRTVSVWP